MQRKRAILAIEIGEKEIKLGYSQVRHSKSNIVSLERFDVGEGEDEHIVEEIRRYVKNIHIKKPEVFNIIPSNLTISKNIEIPSVDKKEIKDIINLQANRHTPYSREEIIMDYIEIDVIHGRYTKVLLVIVKKEIVARRYELIKKAGLNVDKTILSSDAEALFGLSFCRGGLENVPVGVVHIDRIYTDFIVVRQKKYIYIRSIPIGSMEILSHKEEVIDNFLQELRKSLEAYQAENIDVFPKVIYFTGVWGVLSTQKVKKIERDFDTKFEIFPYYEGLNLTNEVINKIQENKYTSFLPVIASLLYIDELRLDLTPEDVRIKREVREQAKKIIQMGILFMAVFFTFCATLLTNLFFKKMYLRKLLLSYTEEIQQARVLKEISQRKEIIKRLIAQKRRALSILAELIKFIPQEIFLNSVQVQEDNTIVLTATANCMSRVFSFVTELESSEFFKNVKVDFTETRRVGDKEVADFGLTFMWEKAFLEEIDF